MEHGVWIGRGVAYGAAAEAWPLFLAESAQDAADVSVADADAFARAAILAICEAGVPAWEGRRAFQRCWNAISMGVTVRTVFRHAGKADAIDAIWRERERLFSEFESADDKFGALTALPWIGAVTRQRLAQRLGLTGPDDSAEPGDRTPAARPHGRPRTLPGRDPAPLARIGARS